MAKKYIAGKNKIITTSKSKVQNNCEINHKTKKSISKLYDNNFSIRIKKTSFNVEEINRSSSPDFFGFDLSSENLKEHLNPALPNTEFNNDSQLIIGEEDVQIAGEFSDEILIHNYANEKTSFLNNNTKYFYNILSTPAELECWTGIKNLEIFKNIVNKIKEFKIKNNLLMRNNEYINLIPIEELLTLIMIRIKTNLNFLRMSTLFNMCEEELMNRFDTFLPIIRSILYTNKTWPSKRLGKSFCLILEPFEFLLENNTTEIKEYSTVKAMIGFSTTGTIIWSSDIYSQTATYNDICMKEGIYDKLRRIDTVTVRKNIGVHYEFKKRGIFCYIDDKIVKKNVNKIRQDIRQQINSFEIFQKPISHSMLSYLDDILSIICLIINMK